MTDMEVQKLSRKELLELLLDQSVEMEKLQSELAQAQMKLRKKELVMEKAGSIAVASLALNGVFEAAQKAADQYLVSVRQTEQQNEQLRLDAERQAAQIIAEAEDRAAAIEAAAKAQADRYWKDVSERLQRFYDERAGLMDILRFDHRVMGMPMGQTAGESNNAKPVQSTTDHPADPA